MTNKFKLKLFPAIALTLVFVLPLILSNALYYCQQHFNFKTMNHGVLINPLVHISGIEEPKKWRVLFMAGEKCNASCTQKASQLQQIHNAVGKNFDRVRVIVVYKNAYTDSSKAFTFHQNQTYLIDPLDNVFMSYASSSQPMDVLKDIKRMLEVSQIG